MESKDILLKVNKFARNKQVVIFADPKEQVLRQIE
jgi:hypothetical protein